MELFNLQVIALIGISLALALTGIWSARLAAARLAILALFGGAIGVAFGASSQLLGQARPVAIEWLAPQANEADILNGHLVEEHGIFLTVMWNDDAPELYVLPWNMETAQQLQDALAKAENNGTRARFRMPRQGDPTDSDETLFYAPPQPEPAAKRPPGNGTRLG